MFPNSGESGYPSIELCPGTSKKVNAFPNDGVREGICRSAARTEESHAGGMHDCWKHDAGFQLGQEVYKQFLRQNLDTFQRKSPQIANAFLQSAYDKELT